MALKDWKLVQKVRTYNRNQDFYVNQRNGTMISIDKTGEKYAVFKDLINRITFDVTKQRALKSAKAYMRTH